MAGTGEFLVRGETVAAGWVGEDGWLRTGDLGRMDEEGHLWITGRLSDLIISGGVNVDPEEVAEHLRAHPGVAEAAVVGLPDPDWGERVVALVVPHAIDPVQEETLRARAREVLSPAKRPREYRFAPALPLSANGKVDREAVRALFSSAEGGR